MIMALLIVSWIALIATWIILLRLPRAKPDIEALADAVTKPRQVFIVTRRHTGALDVTKMDLSVVETLDIGTQLIQAGLMAQYEHIGKCEAEAYANGEIL